MKTFSRISAILFAIMVSTVGFTQIAGSLHDFSGAAWNIATQQICVVCHTPHNAISTFGAPLWNHTLTAKDPYDVYANAATLDSSPETTLTGNSKLCLSCHDGTVAIDAFGGNVGTTTMDNTNGKLIGGTLAELSDDHPIGFAYTTALATTDGELKNPSVDLSGLPAGGTIAADMLFSDRLECATCHDVHDKQYGTFLRKSNNNSALCITCHSK